MVATRSLGRPRQVGTALGLDALGVEGEQLDDRRPEELVDRAHHREVDLVRLDSKRGEARWDEPVCRCWRRALHYGWQP